MKRILASLFLAFCISVTISKAQSLAVNNDGSTADASAILDVKSTSKGLLIPRVTATSSVSNPATGLLVYVTGSGFFYNAGTSASPSWKQLLPSDGNGSSLTSLPAANLTGTLPAISGANLTNLPAANLTGTLPAISGTNLTNLPAVNLTGTLPAISGANLTSLNAGNLSTGTFPAGRMPALTGDVTNTTGSLATTIANNAVTTAKIADNSVTVAKISTTSGTPSANTYLSGAGTWTTPAGGGGGGSVELVANITSSQNTTTGTTIDIIFGTATTSPTLTGASYNTTTGEYTVGTAGGTFLVVANVTGSTGIGWVAPTIVADGVNYYGGAGLNSQFPSPTSRGCAVAVVTLASGKKIKVTATANSTVGTMTNESRLTIVKLF